MLRDAIMTFKKQFFAAVLLIAAAAPAAARQSEAGPVHEQAVAEMLDAALLPEATLASLREAAGKLGPNQEFIQEMARRITRADVVKVQIAAMAPLLTTAQARRVSQAYATPEGKKKLAYDQEVLRAGARASSLVKRTSAEYQALNRFQETPAIRAYLAARKQAMPAINEALSNSMNTLQETLFQRAVAGINEHFEPFATHGPVAPTAYQPPPSGLAYVDQWAALTAATEFRRLSGQWRYLTEQDALGQATMLAPESLASAEKVARSLEAMDELDEQTAQYLTERDLNLNDYYAAAMAIEKSRQRSVAPLEEALRNEQRLNAQLGVAKRAVLGTTRRILLFAQARKGRLGAENGKLMLATREDVQIYDAYIAQLRSDVASVNDVIGRLNIRRTSWL